MRERMSYTQRCRRRYTRILNEEAQKENAKRVPHCLVVEPDETATDALIEHASDILHGRRVA